MTDLNKILSTHSKEFYTLLSRLQAVKLREKHKHLIYMNVRFVFECPEKIIMLKRYSSMHNYPSLQTLQKSRFH